MVQLALSDDNTILVSASGDLLAGGANDEGQLGPSVQVAAAVHEARIVDMLSTERAVHAAAGLGFTVALTSGRTSVSWGINESGQLGHSPDQAYNVVPRMMKGVQCPIVQIAAGAQHALLLGSDGCVYALGSNACAQLGMNGRFKRETPTPIPALTGTPVRFITSGDFHCVAVDAGGTAFSWGRNKYGQCGQGVTTGACLPKQMDTGAFCILSAACGSNHTALVSRSGRLLTCGQNTAGQCGVPGQAGAPGVEATDQAAPSQGLCRSSDAAASKVGVVTVVGGALQQETVRQVACGSRHTLILTTAGDVFAFGDNTSGQLGLGMTREKRCVWFPEKVSSVSGAGTFTVAAAGETSGLIRLSKGRVMSYPVGAVPFGTMRALDSATFTRVASSAAAGGHKAAMRQLISAVFASPSTLGGSFLLPMIETKTSSGASILALMDDGSAAADGPLSLVRQASTDDAVAQRLGLISTSASEAPHAGLAGLPHLRATMKRSELRPSAWTPSAVGGSPVEVQRGAATPDAQRSGMPVSSFASFMQNAQGRVHCLPWERDDDIAVAWRATSGSRRSTQPTVAFGTAASGAGAHLSPVDFFNLESERDVDAAAGADAGGRATRSAASRSQTNVSLNTLMEEHSFIDIYGAVHAYGVLLQDGVESAQGAMWSAIGSGLQTLEPLARQITQKGAIRSIAVYIMCPLFARTNATSAQVFAGLLAVVLTMPGSTREQLLSWLVSDLSFDQLTELVIQPAQAHLSYYLRLALGGRSADAVLTRDVSLAERLQGLGGVASGVKPDETGALRTGQVNVAECVDLTMAYMSGLWNACQAETRNHWAGHIIGPQDYFALVQEHTSYSAPSLMHLSGQTLRQLLTRPPGPAEEAGDVTLRLETVFYNEHLSEMPQALLARDYQRWRVHGYSRGAEHAAFASSPFLLSPACKRRYMQLESSLQMQAHIQRAAALSIFTGQNNPFFTLNVRREHVVEDAAAELARCSLADLKRPLRIHFVGEEGVDAGGLKREFFHLVCEELLSGKFGLFVENEDDHTLFFNPAATAMSAEFTLLGKLVGLAIFNGILLELNLARVVYQKMLGHKVGVADLASVNRQLFSGLMQLLSYPGSDVEAVFCIDFTASYTFFGHTETVDLIPNGTDMPVTSENKHEYVHQFCDWYLNKSVMNMFENFMNGFHVAMTGQTMQLCTALDLEQLVVGSTELDFSALRASARYDGGLTPTSDAVEWLWSIVLTCSPAEQRLFLKFVTGTDRAPIGGLSKVQMTVQGNGTNVALLPSSSTCFNVLLLPQYGSQAEMRSKLLQAIYEGSAGFGLR